MTSISEAPGLFVLWHPGGQRVAVQGGHLPALELGKNPAKVVQDALNIPVWLLDDAGVSFGQTGGMPRLRALAEALPEGYRWQEMDVPALPFPRRWHAPDWPEVVAQRLTFAGLEGARLKPLYANDLTAVVQVEHANQTYFFKCNTEPQEMKSAAYIARHFPALTPAVVVHDETENWMVTVSGGKLLDSIDDLALWQQAISRLAQFQQQADASALAALGCPAYPLAELRESVAELLGQRDILQDWGLSEKHLEPLQSASADIRRGFDLLEALGLPEVPAHGDAHVRNALAGEGGAVWFDWSEAASAAYPLLDFGWFLAFALHPARENLPIRVAVPDLETKLMSGILRAWNLPESARPTLGAAIPLAYLCRAVQYDRKYRDWQGNIAGWRPQYVPYYLRQAAWELERLSF